MKQDIKNTIKDDVQHEDIKQDMKQDIKNTIKNDVQHEDIKHSNEISSSTISATISFNNLNNKSDNLQTIPEIQHASLTPKIKYIAMLDGADGENYVLNLIQSIRNDFEMHKVSFTGHVADIHAIDYNSNPPIKYVVEVKNKKTISHDDLIKYDKDINGMQNEEFIIIGIFLSLESEYIPSIGEYKISQKSVYLTKKYINKECLSVIFNYMPLLQACKKCNISTESLMNYIIPENVYNLAYTLKTYSNKISEQIKLLEKIKESSLQNIKDIETVIINYTISNDLVNEIKSLLNLPKYDAQLSMEEKARNGLHNYLKENKNWRKSVLIEKFPILKTELASMKKNDIIEKYLQKLLYK